MPKEISAVIYARVSSKEQAEKELSIPAQLEAMRNYCKQKGWKLVCEYIDAGKSAKTDERPEFQRMIAMAKKQNRNFDNIVVHKFDRFSRNREDHVIYK
jgi:site-specific DNA recombinase